MEKFARFAQIAEIEFSDIVVSSHDLGHKLRVYLKDKSFIDLFFSENSKNLRFAIHWERVHIDKSIYRIDNAPHPKWKKVKTFPIHFHNGKYGKVGMPPFSTKDSSLENIFRNFLLFSRSVL